MKALEELKEILQNGVESALRGQVESTNRSYVMQGKGDAFKEVLAVIKQLEERDGGEDTTSAKEEDKK